MDTTTEPGADASRPSAQPRTTVHLDQLSRAIAHAPDAPANYVLRGEEWLVCGEPVRAAQDFAQGIRLAEHELAGSAWGYVLQALIDRAEVGLRACQPRTE